MKGGRPIPDGRLCLSGPPTAVPTAAPWRGAASSAGGVRPPEANRRVSAECAVPSADLAGTDQANPPMTAHFARAGYPIAQERVDLVWP